MALALVLAGMVRPASAGNTSVAGYATYWDGSSDGAGIGVKVRKRLLDWFSTDVRISYVDFDDQDSWAIPLEGSLLVSYPSALEPYAGIGAGYYRVDLEHSHDDTLGAYGMLGLQVNLFVIDAFAELRYNTTGGRLLDGMSANLGLVVKW